MSSALPLRPRVSAGKPPSAPPLPLREHFKLLLNPINELQPATSEIAHHAAYLTSMNNSVSSTHNLNVLPASDSQEYELILQSLLRKYAPANGEETVLVESLAQDVWTSRRMVRLR